MKSILVIFSQGSGAGQTLLEALSATMVLATFGLKVNVCLINDAVSLLQAPIAPASFNGPQAFKSAFGMVESFEFYDLLPVWVCRNTQEQLQQFSPSIEFEFVDLNSALLAQFDQVLYW